jgi:subtilisin family serine protease
MVAPRRARKQSSRKKVPPLKQSDIERQKLQPKLQMVANGSTKVNVMRAEMSSCVAVESSRLVTRIDPVSVINEAPKTRRQLAKAAKIGDQRQISAEVYANVFIETSARGDGQASAPLPGETARKGNLITATVPLAALRGLAREPHVTRIQFGEPLAAPTPIVARTSPRAPNPNRHRFGTASRHHSGAGVLIGIVDVQGFDFSHPDFLDGKHNTRFVAIWDQAGEGRPNPKDAGTAPFDYGAEITQAHMNAALKAAPDLGLPPFELERQSQMAEASHGTHVASIAAGNRGICPKAGIAGVLVSLPEGDLGRRQSFYDSTRIVHAIDYLFALGDKLGMPVSINVSLGTNGHAHDSSSAVNRWVDMALTVPGRSVCVAAGNAGQEASEFEGDSGFVMGRIHTSGRIAARELNADIEWLVIGNGKVDVSENELEIWYGPQDRFAVSVRPPEREWIGPVGPRELIENKQLPDGSLVSIYNELYHPANGANYISIYLSPFFAPSGVVGVPAGSWTVRLHGLEVRDGSYHGWIERDDPRRLGRTGAHEFWSFPSFFSQRSNVDNSSVSSLACGLRVISVGNLDFARERINITSSQGPTRDGRQKPEVVAPGTGIVAAKGFGEASDPWVEMTGTSMASPHVAGVVGLMLAIEPKLTAAQINGIILRTARPLPGASFTWATDAGFGRLDEEACLAEAGRVNEHKDLTPKR